MTFEEIEKEVSIVDNNVKTDSPKYVGFKTQAGKEFQESFKELSGFTLVSNIILGIIHFYPITNNFINNLTKNIPDDVKIKAINEEDLTNSQTELTREIFVETGVNLIDSYKPDNAFVERLTKYVERLNSCFFLSLYAYMDYYIEKVYEVFRSKLNTETIIKLDKIICKRGDLNNKITEIKRALNLVTREEFGKLISGDRHWKENFDEFLCSRHIMAHENPLARIQFLEEKFPIIAEDARKETQKLPEKIANQLHIDTSIINKLFEILESNIYISNMLTEISKDCFCYLAMIDILIDNKLHSGT